MLHLQLSQDKNAGSRNQVYPSREPSGAYLDVLIAIKDVTYAWLDIRKRQHNYVWTVLLDCWVSHARSNTWLFMRPPHYIMVILFWPEANTDAVILLG